MDDRELIERAAKAAGYNVRWHEHLQCFVHVDPFNTDNPPTLAGQRMVWNPLTDDGDALRLAVKLRIDIVSNSTLGREVIFAFGHGLEGDAQPLGGDEMSATRRAIVRAAAAIANNQGGV